MKRLNFFAFTMVVACFAVVRSARNISKPIYVSLPGPGNVQHLAYAVAKEKKFYDEMGLTNVNIVVLRGNAMNVQALLSGSVHYSSAFGPSMQAMFKGEQIRVLLADLQPDSVRLDHPPGDQTARRSKGDRRSP